MFVASTSQSIRNNVSVFADCSVQFRNRINACNVILKCCNKFHCIVFFNCPLCLNFPFLLLSFARVAFLCESLTTLPPDKRKCVQTSYFAFCFFCVSYCSRVIHLGLLSILFRSSLLRSLSILSSIIERYLRNSQKLAIICIGSTAP